MRIITLVKHVRDTETRVKVAENGAKLEFIGENWVLNPYDEFAVEEGLRLKEKFGGEVVALSVGDEESSKSLRQAMAMGADSAILLSDPLFNDLDPLSTARVIAEQLKKESFDLILCGKHGVGDDNQAVGSIVGALLNIPVATVVVNLEIQGSDVKAKREIEGGLEVLEMGLPCLISCQKGLNEPRYPSLKGIMSAKKKEIRTINASVLGIDEKFFSKRIKFITFLEPPPRPKGKIIEGEPKDVVKELVKLLREEAKVL
jgi:electron transfer flavoprotein beta subunit